MQSTSKPFTNIQVNTIKYIIFYSYFINILSPCCCRQQKMLLFFPCQETHRYAAFWRNGHTARVYACTSGSCSQNMSVSECKSICLNVRLMVIYIESINVSIIIVSSNVLCFINLRVIIDSLYHYNLYTLYSTTYSVLIVFKPSRDR